MKRALAILLLFSTPLFGQITSGPKTATVVGTTLTLTPLDTLAIFNRGKASVVCPPTGFSRAQVDSAFVAGKSTAPDSIVTGGNWPTKVYKPVP